MCAENEDIVLLKVDWDQNKPIARPLGVKVTSEFHTLFLRTCLHTDTPTVHVKRGESTWLRQSNQHSLCRTSHMPGRQPFVLDPLVTYPGSGKL